MRFLPWYLEVFTSPLIPAELLQRVQATVAAPPTLSNLLQNRPVENFQGWVSGNSFELQRIEQGRNAIRPVIEGQVKANYTGGSELQLRYRLSWLTLAFASLWLGITGVWFIAEMRQMVVGASLFGALLLFGFGLLLFTLPFWWEVNESQQLLTYLLQLEPKAA